MAIKEEYQFEQLISDKLSKKFIHSCFHALMFDEGLEKFVSSVGVDGKCKFTENAYYLTISSCVLFLLWASRVTLAKIFFLITF